MQLLIRHGWLDRGQVSTGGISPRVEVGAGVDCESGSQCAARGDDGQNCFSVIASLVWLFYSCC